MNLLKNHANYLLDLVTRDLEVNRKLPTELRNFRWEIKLEEIINTLKQDVKVKKEYVLGEWVVQESGDRQAQLDKEEGFDNIDWVEQEDGSIEYL